MQLNANISKQRSKICHTSILFKRGFTSLLEFSMKVCMVAVINISTSLHFHIVSAPYVFSSSLFDGGRNLIFSKASCHFGFAKTSCDKYKIFIHWVNIDDRVTYQHILFSVHKHFDFIGGIPIKDS